MANDYTLLADVKALFPSSNFGTSLDALITSMITRASRAVDAFLYRHPGAFSVDSDVTRYFDGNGGRQLWIGELAAIPTTVSMAETGDVDNVNGTGGAYTALSVNDFWCWPQNALADGMPFLRLDLDVLNGSKSIWYRFPRGVKIVGKFGFSTTANIPPEIKMATDIQVVRWVKRAQQAFQDAGAITDLRQLTYVKDLDPDVKNILSMDKFATSNL